MNEGIDGIGEVAVRPAIDLLDPYFHVGDPHPAYRWLRHNDPVHHVDGTNLWAVTLLDDVRSVERRKETFVSSLGYRWHDIPGEGSIIAIDDPLHQEQRRRYSKGFTPRASAARAQEVRSVAAACLDELGEARSCDVVETIAARVPATVTARLLGFDDEMWPMLRQWSERLMRLDVAERDRSVYDGIELTVVEMEAVLRGLLEEFGTSPLDPATHIPSAWVEAERDGAMDMRSLIDEMALLVSGGAETTRTTIARGLIELADRPEEWERLAAEPETMPLAVEELVRYLTPLNNMFRTAVEEAEIGGVTVPAGARIMLCYPSANRDEAHFTDPDTLDLQRSPNHHVAFGFGTHVCLGAHVARHTLTETFTELTQRWTRLRPRSVPRYEPNIFVKAVERFELGFAWR